MTLIHEILCALGGAAGNRVQYTVIDGGGGYFENVTRMAEFSPQRIVFCGKKGGVAVEGEALSLGRYGGGDAVVQGRIVRVEQF